MSETEDPVQTLLRLINTKIRVTKDNGDLAKILVSEAALDREQLLREYDAQITLAVDPTLGILDQKLELSGCLRRQTHYLKCIAHSVDKPSLLGTDAGRVMRNKVQKQINDIIRENRTLPYQTVYSFVGLGYPSGDPHKAFQAAASSELAPSDALWLELSPTEYQGIWYSDDVRHSNSAAADAQFAVMLFCFKIGSRAQCVKQLMFTFEGHGTTPDGNGLTVKVWNNSVSAWELTQSGTSGADEFLTITVSANWADYVDAQGNVYLLARTTNPSDGIFPAVLSCDLVQLTVQVRGISYCDVVSYKPVDVTDVKPFLFKTEFQLKGWVFEHISG